MSDQGLIDAAGRALERGVARSRRVVGGDINEAWQLELDDGSLVFLKSRPDASAEEFGAEAAGLAWLAEAEGLRVPEVLAIVDEAGASGLALEWIEPGYLDSAGGEELGRGLAIVHGAGAPAVRRAAAGLASSRPPLRGRSRSRSIRLPTARAGARATRRGSTFSPSAARDDDRIDAATAAAVGRVVERIDELCGPPEPPARVHGDLWSGNVHTGEDGRPWLIDPASHGGHREIDLAMLRLFGRSRRATLAAYEDVLPLADGHEERVALWQLQPLLVHAILFGGSYGDRPSAGRRDFTPERAAVRFAPWIPRSCAVARSTVSSRRSSSSASSPIRVGAPASGRRRLDLSPATPERSIFNSVFAEDPQSLAASIDELDAAYAREGVRGLDGLGPG